MEAEGTHHLYARSLEKHGIRYNPFVGDGDCKSYTKICKLQPYGPTVYIPKEDCIARLETNGNGSAKALNHVQRQVHVCDPMSCVQSFSL